jgi:integrase
MAGFYEQKDRDGITIGWQAKVRRKGYPSQSKVFRTRREAEAWARSIESEMDRGIFAPRGESEKTTLGECFERYLAEVTPTKRAGSQTAERRFIHQWLRRPLSSRIMASIRGVDVARVIKEMEAEGKGANTIRLHLAVLSHLFTVAKSNWGMASLDNPVSSVRKPRLPGGRERRLIPGEMGALLGALDLNMACLVVLAVETAMRQGEIAALTWDNVRLKDRSLFLPKTKNGDARTVPLSPAAIEALNTVPRRSEGKESVFGISGAGIDSAWGRARAAAGIAGGWGDDALHFHDLRHEATSRFFERTDLDIMEIRAITGHKNLQMLARYTHLRTANLADRLAGGKRGAWKGEG